MFGSVAFGEIMFGQGFPVEVYGDSYSDSLSLSMAMNKGLTRTFLENLGLIDLGFSMLNVFQQVVARATGALATVLRSSSSGSADGRSSSTMSVGSRSAAAPDTDSRSVSAEDTDDRSIRPEIT